MPPFLVKRSVVPGTPESAEGFNALTSPSGSATGVIVYADSEVEARATAASQLGIDSSQLQATSLAGDEGTDFDAHLNELAEYHASQQDEDGNPTFGAGGFGMSHEDIYGS